MPQRKTSAPRIRDFSHPSWIIPTMILQLSQSAKKLKDMTRHVIKLLIVQPKIENLLFWDKKFFLLRAAFRREFPDSYFFSSDFVTWLSSEEIYFEPWSCCFSKKEREKISLTKSPFASDNLGRYFFAKLDCSKSAIFIQKPIGSSFIWTNFEKRFFLPVFWTKFGSYIKLKIGENGRRHHDNRRLRSFNWLRITLYCINDDRLMDFLKINILFQFFYGKMKNYP